jgi:hypothetical protein
MVARNRPRASMSRLKRSMSARRTWKTSDLELVQLVLLTPGGEHPQIERICVAGQTAVGLGTRPARFAHRC